MSGLVRSIAEIINSTPAAGSAGIVQVVPTFGAAPHGPAVTTADPNTVPSECGAPALAGQDIARNMSERKTSAKCLHLAQRAFPRVCVNRTESLHMSHFSQYVRGV
jgi:hypothetical protein